MRNILQVGQLWRIQWRKQFSSQTFRRSEKSAARKRLDEEKLRALTREDFALPIQLFRLFGYLIIGGVSIFSAHTIAVHGYAEITNPTPAAFGFWGRVHLRRAWLYWRHQNNPLAAAKYLSQALSEANDLSKVDLWKEPYLGCALSIAFMYLRTYQLIDAVNVYQLITSELRDQIHEHLATAQDPLSPPEHVKEMIRSLVLIESKLVGVLIRMGRVDEAVEVAKQCSALIARGTRLPENDALEVRATLLMTLGDAYVVQNSWNNAKSTFQQIIELDDLLCESASNAEVPLMDEQNTPLLALGYPRLSPGRCLSAIAHFHMGDTQIASKKIQQLPSSSNSWWHFNPISLFIKRSQPTVSADDLAWFEGALRRAEKSDNKFDPRSCAECRAITLSTLGKVFLDEKDEIQAERLLRLGLQEAREIADVDAEEVCKTNLQLLGVDPDLEENVESDDGNSSLEK
jgi:tetratricopeptide (TPR) repeat protein